MAKNTPKRIVSKFKDNLINVDANKSRNLLYIERAIGICSSTLLEMREFVIQYNFKYKEEEIPLFKLTKHVGLSEYLFYSNLFEVETRQPVISIESRKKLKKMISEAQFF